VVGKHMSSIPYIIMEIINWSNITNRGLFRIGFDPYLALMGNYLWGVLFGVIGVGLYANERSIGTTAIYMILIGIFTAVIIPDTLVALFGLITAFLIGIIFYRAFLER
jgi:hypothetical protein